MKDSLPTRNSPPPPTEADYPMMIPGDGEGGSPSPIKFERYLIFLKRCWWVPVVTLGIAVGGYR